MKEQALQALRGNWGKAVVLLIVYVVLAMIVGGITGGFGDLLLVPMGWGVVVAFLRLLRGGELKVEDLFSGYRSWGPFLVMLLTGVYTLLWMLLLVVPGVVKSYSYALAPYVLLDNPELSSGQCIDRSMEIMDGHKMELFRLDLSFVGWMLLGVVSFGIGLLWVYPYWMTARAAFYENLVSGLEKGDSPTSVVTKVD